ncbi:hypothetical protein [Solimonas marina]|uniref:SH3 domain-containing protein n=1 Tax=Solimonas marina TaxID=2714601 RepID=A0A969WBP0_9GAMM|nr:hypothetical protein [Solimonas marina]NKF23073.1 hypothetical protein [Solimonas marina]
MMVVAVLLAMLGIGGCASQDVLDEKVASRIRTVALLQISEPQVEQIDHYGKDNESHSTAYAQLLASAGIQFAPLLAESISRRLGDSGYHVNYLTQDYSGYGGQVTPDSAAARSGADAILLVRLKRIAYVSPGKDGALQPWVQVDVQLFDPNTHDSLYARQFNAGYAGDAGKAVRLPVDPKYRYLTASALHADVDASAGGLKDAMLAIGAAIGEDFAKGTRPMLKPSEAAMAAAQAAPAAPPQTAEDRDRATAEALAAQWSDRAPPVPAAPPPVAPPADTLNAVQADAQADEVPTPAAVPAAPVQPPAAAPLPEAPVPTAPPPVVAAAAPAEPISGAFTLPQAITVHAQPLDTAETVGELPAGAAVKVDPRVIHNPLGDWRYVTGDGASGWVQQSALQP